MMRWVVIFLLLVGIWQWWIDRSIPHASGVMVAVAPEQEPVAAPPPHFSKNGYNLTGLARFSLQARVLGVERYRWDRESELVPIDLALGWGPMSDTSVLAKISISQGGRFYLWHTSDFPIPRREIEVNSANMHLIPATHEVERVIKEARVGHIVQLTGYLVEARRSDGWRWTSSLTREDTGTGACELIWVERIELR